MISSHVSLQGVNRSEFSKLSVQAQAEEGPSEIPQAEEGSVGCPHLSGAL